MKNKRNKRGLSLVTIILIVVAVIVIVSAGIACIFIFNGKDKNNDGDINSPNSNLSGTATSTIPEKILYKPNEDEQIYFNKQGEMLDLKSLVSNDSRETDFSYGTGVVEDTQGRTALINYKGETVIDYGTYNNIIYTGYNYIAINGDYTLLDLNGNAINDVLYDNISQLDFQGVYLAKKDNVTQIITATGVVLHETEDYLMSSDLEIWESPREFVVIWVNNSDLYIIDKNKFECKYHFKSDNVGVGLNYVTDITHNVTYAFDDQVNEVLELKDCLIETDTTWNKYRSIYEGVEITNHLSDYGYLGYLTTNNKVKIMYKDGTTLTEYEYDSEFFSLLSDCVIGEDYIFIQNGTNVDVYNKNEKVTTLENREINYNAISLGMDASQDVVALINYTSKVEIYLYDGKGNSLNDTAYSKKSNIGNLLLSTDGKTYRVLANGELMDAKNYEKIDLLVNEETGKYSNQYFIGEMDDKTYIIDREANSILEINSYRDVTLYEDSGILMCGTTDRKYCAYQLNDRKEILTSEEAIEYNKEYQIIEETKYHGGVYSIIEGKMYQYNQ